MISTVEIEGENIEGGGPVFEGFPTVRIENESAGEIYCANCAELLTEYPLTVWWADGTSEPTICAASEVGQHAPESHALAWLKSVRVAASDRDNTLTVNVKVGSNETPFTLQMGISETGDLIIHVPHPEDGYRHATMTPYAGRPDAYTVSSKDLG